MTAGTLVRKASKVAATPGGLVTRRRHGDLSILLYHRVGDATAEIELSAEVLRRQFEYLVERERVLSLDQALSDPAEGGVVITFDDGYHDFHEKVVPLLVEFAIPATLYLATGLVAEEGGSVGESLSWAAIREAVDTGLVTVGSHTHSHADLTRADEATCEDEMRRSKELIEEQVDLACEHFAYPWSVGSPTADRVARTLFRSAALDAWKTNRAGRVDPYRLGRVPILRSDGLFFFRRKVRGQLDAEALLYRMLGRGPWGRA